MLSIINHDRDVVNLTYVYPVVSRRAGGVSLGINLSPNNQCNWHCVYCQVPNLARGVSPAADLALLGQELDTFLQVLLYGDYMVKHVPKDCQTLQDIALSGNGEPTTCPNFMEVVVLITALMEKYQLDMPLRLITNGSGVHKSNVQQGLKLMAAHRGEVWFKVDAVGEEQTQTVNGVSLKPAWQQQQLQLASSVCPTWLQTCVLWEQSQDENYMVDYLAWLAEALTKNIQVKGVLLYGLARPSMQEGGEHLKPASKAWMQTFAEKIESLGLSVKVS